jgi:hypothetical protein
VRVATLTERPKVEHRLGAESDVRVILRGLGPNLAAIDLQVFDVQLGFPKLIKGRGKPEALEVQGAEGQHLQEPQDLCDEPEDQPEEDDLHNRDEKGWTDRTHQTRGWVI